jgi:hypothetical protein
MKASNLDQFYTSPKIAEACIALVESILPIKSRQQFLEPSAGSGSFSSKLNHCISLDLDPKLPSIIEADFLTTQPANLAGLLTQDKVCIIGNPPFGKNSSLAVKFFNHSTTFGNSVCFILPKTFKKRSIHKRLNLHFHLVHEWDLPKKSFIYLGQAYDVPCVFQIWIKKEDQRVIEKNEFTNEWFDFVKKSEGEAAIRRVGGRSGLAYFDFANAAESSHYFIKSKGMPMVKLVDYINGVDFSKIVNSTAGVRSLSKFELIKELKKILPKV